MKNQILRHLTACVTALMLFPTSSGAQSPATTFDELRLVLHDGNDVVVTDSNGRRTRGKLVSVTTSSLDLVVERPRFLILRERSNQSFTDTVVTTVTRIASGGEGLMIVFFLRLFLLIILLSDNRRDDGGFAFFNKISDRLWSGSLGT